MTKRRKAFKATAIVACVAGIVVSFQNCSQFAALDPAGMLEQASAVRSSMTLQTVTGSSVCEALRANLNPTETANALQACIDNAPAGSKLLLPAKIHSFNKTIQVKKSLWIATEGVGFDDAACRENNPVRCAELRPSAPFTFVDRGAIRFDAASITVDHIVVNGNKSARQGTEDARLCAALVWNHPGVNIQVTGPGFTAHKISSINALCSTALEGAGYVADLKITSSYIAHAGTHNQQNMWADGITIHDSRNAIISDNEFIDSTDIDLIFGGCQDCLISNNVIRHTDSHAGSTFAGLMLHAWPGSTSGNFNGSKIINNTIDCGNYRCGFGMLIGASPWYAAPTFGGTYSGNIIRNAQVGIAINDITGPIEFADNQVTGANGRFHSSAGVRNTYPMTMTAGSSNYVRWLGGANASQFVVADYTGAIMNWWNGDWTTMGLGPTSSSVVMNPVPVTTPTPVVVTPPTLVETPVTQPVATAPAPTTPVATPTPVVTAPASNAASNIPTPSPISIAAYLGADDYLTAVYQRYLGRAPKAEEFTYWRSTVTFSKSYFVTEVVNSNEFNTRYGAGSLSNSDYVAVLYKLLLSRNVDSSGLATWTNQLNAGQTRKWVIQQILSTGEAQGTNGF